MTKKFIFLLLLMFTGLQIMQAQQAYSIKGIVKDAANGEPVSFANVVIWKGLSLIRSANSRSPESLPEAIACKPPLSVINQQLRLNSEFPTRTCFFRSNWKKVVKACKK